MDLTDPAATVTFVADAFERASIEHALCGGLLAAAYGAPRETIDADFAVADAVEEVAATALRAAGLDVEVTFRSLRMGGVTVGRLTLLPGGGAQGLNVVDLVRPRSARFARSALDRAVRGELQGRPLRVLTPEDLILFEAVSTRELDLVDGARLLRALGEQVDRDAVALEASRLEQEIPEARCAARFAEMVSRADRREPL